MSLPTWLPRPGRLATQFAVPASLVLIAVWAVLAVVQLGPGPDPRFNTIGRVMGHDFSHFWVAGRAVLEGRPADPFDATTHFANQQRTFGDNPGQFGWHYPPPFLLPAAALATLSLPLAFLVWMLSTNALLLFALWRLVPDWRATLVVAGSPMVFINVNFGQNAALSAALVAFALAPFVRGGRIAGWPVALLIYKPTLGAPWPVAMAAGGFWRSILATLAWIAALVAGTTLLLGLDVWPAFVRSLSESRSILLDQIFAGLNEYASAYGAARLVGLPYGPALAFQAASAVGALALLALAWRSEADRRLKGALLAAAIPLCTPYLLHYDMLVLAPAALLFWDHARHGDDRERVAGWLAALWASPYAWTIAADHLRLPLAFLTALAFFAAIWLRARRTAIAQV